MWCVVNANSADHDQTPRSAPFDLGLHCLPMSILLDARHKRCQWKQLCQHCFCSPSDNESSL